MSKMDLVQHVQSRKPEPRANVEQVLGGVTASWLAQVFQMDVKDVKRRLASCPPLTEGKEDGRGYRGRTYDLKDAAPYLVRPKISAASFLKAVKKAELPPPLTQSFWDAMLKRQKYEENAGDLWRTDKIRQVLGETFQSMKFTIQLWVDTIERVDGLSNTQRKTLIRLVDQLQQDLFDALVQNKQLRSTGPQSAELPQALGESAEEAEVVEDYDPEVEDLI